MFSYKKKGTILENKFAKNLMRFVFAYLSFFFVLTGKCFAEKKEYKYIFDAGNGHKLTYTVEEELSYSASNPQRYSIKNKELEGWADNPVDTAGRDGERIIYMSEKIGCDLSKDSNVTMYNWCTYLQVVTASPESRKFMKALLMTFADNGYDIIVGDKTNKEEEEPYLKPGIASSEDAEQDNDFTYFWYFDHYFLNVNFKDEFDSMTGSKTPYVRKYLDENHIFLKNTSRDTVSLKEKIRADQTCFAFINQSIENESEIGKYFESCKVPVDGQDVQYGDELVWWYREGSFEENEKSILVDCAKNKGDTPLFTFKYSKTGELLEQPPYLLKTNGNGRVGLYGRFEYRIDLNDGVSGNSIYVYPDYTGGTKKTCSGKFVTGTKKKEQTSQFYLACNGLSYAQTGAQYIYVTDFMPENLVSTSKVFGDAYGDKVCTIEAAKLDEIILNECGSLDDGLLTKENNGYVFAYDKSTGYIHFYKKDDPAENNYIGMNMNLKSFYAPFVDATGKNTYGISLKADPEGRDKTHFKAVYTRVGYDYQYRLNVLTTANGIKVYNDREELYDISWSIGDRKKAMYFNLYEDSDTDCLLSVRDLSQLSEGWRGQDRNTTIPLEKCPVIAEVSIRDWIEIEYQPETERVSREVKRRTESDSLTAALRSIEETRAEMVPFIKMLFRYARPIILFLALVALCLTAVYAIFYNGDPEKRALVKIRIKNILVGITVFAVSALIIALAIEYFTQAADLMMGEDKSLDLAIVNPYSMDKNWLLKLILKLIGVVADAIRWVIDFIASRLLRLDQRELNLATCIFDVENGGGVTLYPFEEKEWSLYIWGYIMLSAVSIAMIAIAIVKNIVMMIVGAGNTEKVTLVKQDFLRIFICILCIAIVPYAIRLMLTIVNNLVLLLPLSSSAFNLTFDQYNDLEPVLNLIYYILEIKVYLAFTVRKVMIAFLTISTPVIFGIWAVSDKFRSFNLWLGELMTNIFMQFTYGFSFFFLIMIISNNRNPIVILLMLSMLIRLSDFVKDSLQGLFNEWGGINETAVAEEAYSKLESAPRKVWGEAGKVKNKVGGTLRNIGNAYDKSGTSVASKRLNNIGAILTGDWGKIRTERERLENIKKHGDSTQGKKLRNKESMLTKDIESRIKLEGDEEARKLYILAVEGKLTPEQIKNLRETGGLKGEIAELAGVKTDISEHDKTIKNLENQIDNLDGISKLKGSVSKDVLKQLKEQSKKENNNVADIYEHTLNDFDKLEEDMNKSIDKLSDPNVSPEDKIKEEATLKHVLEQVIDKAQIISEVSVELNMTGGTERMEKIKDAQAFAVREKADRFDKELKTEAMDSVSITQNNLETLEIRAKNAENPDNAPKDISKKKPNVVKTESNN